MYRTSNCILFILLFQSHIIGGFADDQISLLQTVFNTTSIPVQIRDERQPVPHTTLITKTLTAGLPPLSDVKPDAGDDLIIETEVNTISELAFSTVPASIMETESPLIREGEQIVKPALPMLPEPNYLKLPVAIPPEESVAVPAEESDAVPPEESVAVPPEESIAVPADESVAVPPGTHRTGSILIIPNVFDEVYVPGKSFVDQVIELEEKVCKRTCGTSGFPSENSDGHGVQLCDICFCDQACVVLHNCCPDVLLRNITSHDAGHGSDCVQTIPVADDPRDIRFKTMITTCPGDTEISSNTKESQKNSNSDRSNCEEINRFDSLQNIPVRARDTKITYRNIFCARCNNASTTNPDNVVQWKSVVKCKNGMEKLLEGNPDKKEIFRRLNSVEEVARTRCWLEYVGSENAFDKIGKGCSNISTPLIDRCNQTGKWRFYDSRFDRACNLYTAVVFNKYKNMFCYLCNIGDSLNIQLLHKKLAFDGDGIVSPGVISFEALLDFSESYTPYSIETQYDVKESLCGKHQIFDNITCQCRDVMCSEGKELSITDTLNCTSTIQSTFFGYSVCLQIDLVFTKTFFDIDSIMSDLIREMGCCFAFEPLLLRLTAKSWCPGDMNASFNFEVLDYYQFGSKTMNQLDKRALDIFNGLIKDSKYWLPKNLESYSIQLKRDCPEDYVTTKPCSKIKSLEISRLLREYPRVSSEAKIMNKVHFYPFKTTNLCPHIDLPANEFDRMNDSFIHKATRFQLDKDKVDAIDEMTLRLCNDDFSHIMTSTNQSKCDESYVNQSKCNESNSCSETDNLIPWTVAGVVSIISTSLSLLCLFVTFLTYLIFKSLRDASGKNIMTLTLTLFFAQAFFEFAVEQFENKTVCAIFGISIHYFWLAAVFSMNSCTVERFYKLCFPLQSRAFFYSNKPFVLCVVYSLISPLVIVFINILVNYVTTGEIGYGSSRMCYINNLYSRIFAFAVPLAVVLITNLILFAVTIRAIRRQSVPGHKSSSTRIGIKACVQLSFVTGLTWLLLFLYEIISFPFFNYIITSLIGLQGVLFFYSIILNKRVLALYKGLLTSNFKGSSSGHISGSSGSKGRDGMDKKQSPVYKISFGGKMLHSQTTLTTHVDNMSRL